MGCPAVLFRPSGNSTVALMSANTSHRRARHAILRSPASDYAAWELLISCGPCDRPHVAMRVSTLGPGTVADGLRRLRCAGCGGRPSAVLATNGLQGWRQRTIALEGEGAYG